MNQVCGIHVHAHVAIADNVPLTAIASAIAGIVHSREYHPPVAKQRMVSIKERFR